MGVMMVFKIIARAATVGIAAVSLSACVAKDTRVQLDAAHLPRSGQSYYIVPARPTLGSAEFKQYAAAADVALQARGLVPASTPQNAALLVSLDVGVGRVSRQIYASNPLGFFERHLRYDPNSGMERIIPRMESVRPLIPTETKLDYVELAIVRNSDNATLFKGMATARRTSVQRRSLGFLMDGIFARWPT